MELINTGGRPIKELTEIDAIQVEALAAVCTKSQMAAYFGMTEKTIRAVEERQPEVSTAYTAEEPVDRHWTVTVVGAD